MGKGKPTKAEVVRYMLEIAWEHGDGIEVSATRLGEEAAAHFDIELEDPDPDHDIWDWALEAALRYEDEQASL